MVQNGTLEERVTLLEIQVTVIQDDVTDLEVNLMELQGDVNFLFDEQVIQDERLSVWNRIMMSLLRKLKVS